MQFGRSQARYTRLGCQFRAHLRNFLAFRVYSCTIY